MDAPLRKRTRTSIDDRQDSLEAILVDALSIDRLPHAPVQKALEKEEAVRSAALRLCALLEPTDTPRSISARITGNARDRLQGLLDALTHPTSPLDRLMIVEEVHIRVIQIASASDITTLVHPSTTPRALFSLLTMLENQSASLLSLGREIARLSGSADFENLGAALRVDLLLSRDAVAQAVDGVLSTTEVCASLRALTESLRGEMRRRQRLLSEAHA